MLLTDSSNIDNSDTFIDSVISRNYLTTSEINNYIKKSPIIKKKRSYSEPFSNLEFNKVVAFDFDHERGGKEPYPSVFHPIDSGYIDQIFYQKFLNQKETDFLIDILTSEQTYGESKANCFYPSVAFVFYNDTDIITAVDICLDCNSLRSSVVIPSRKTKILEEFDDGFKIYADGFSEKGKKRVIEFSNQLGLEYGDYSRE